MIRLSALFRRPALCLAAAGGAFLSSGCDDPVGGEAGPDRDVPRVEITTPAGDRSVSVATLTLAGVASDSVGIVRVTYRLNGGAEQEVGGVVPGRLVTFDVVVALRPGRNTLVVNAYDRAGHRGASATRSVTLDAAAPAVSLSGRDTVQSAGEFVLRATATDSVGVTTVTYRINGGPETPLPVTPARTVSLAHPIRLAGGESIVAVHAYDAAGNRSGAELRVVQTPFVLASVTSVSDRTCAVDPSGSPFCWGLGYAERTAPAAAIIGFPVRIRSGVALHSPTAGEQHTCGLTAAGEAYCWGGSEFLGHGSREGSSVPVPVAGGLTFSAISAGALHTCAITGGGAAYCWGANGWGRLGSDSDTSTYAPVPVAGGLAFRAIAAGVEHTCGVTTDGAVYCWGNNFHGQLGDGTTTPSRVPVPARVTDVAFERVYANRSSTCALAADGRAYCWGGNYHGEHGRGSTGMTLAPAPAATGLSLRSLALGSRHACGIDAEEKLYCWGYGENGQLGTGAASNSSLPQAVSGGRRYRAVGTGSEHTCAVDAEGTALCWGRSHFGQLGSGPTPSSLVPVPVSNP